MSVIGKALKGVCVFFLILFMIALLAGCGGPKHERKPSSYPPDQEQPPAVEQYPGERTLIVASWYGKDFHGRPTASGEPFDMYAMTCAHKQLPFGTQLRVTSVSNGKEVDCTVNDRGPFVAGRDLDMAFGAAQKIDLIGPGSAKVYIRQVGRDLRYVKTVRYSGTASGTVTIQIGSFREQANAERLKKGLEFKYNNVYIVQAVVRGDTYYRVRLGKYPGRGSAQKAAAELAQEGYDVLITRFEKG